MFVVSVSHPAVVGGGSVCFTIPCSGGFCGCMNKHAFFILTKPCVFGSVWLGALQPWAGWSSEPTRAAGFAKQVAWTNPRSKRRADRARACLRPVHHSSPLGLGRGGCRQRASAPRRRYPTAALGLPRAQLWKDEAGLCRGEGVRALPGRSAGSYTWVCRVMLPSREHLNSCFRMF